ncbi:MAG: hypothetical protein GY755_17060 [Chloroflexi bacterium]|nr:hypothetical protein [Chloroflexota bacterium]
MKLCKAELPDGKPCPTKVDKGQEYCPYHLANQYAKVKKGVLAVAGTVVTGVLTIVAQSLNSSESE